MAAIAIGTERRLPVTHRPTRLPFGIDVFVERRPLTEPLPHNLVDWVGDESSGRSLSGEPVLDTQRPRSELNLALAVRLRDMTDGHSEIVSIREIQRATDPNHITEEQAHPFNLLS